MIYPGSFNGVAVEFSHWQSLCPRFASVRGGRGFEEGQVAEHADQVADGAPLAFLGREPLSDERIGYQPNEFIRRSRIEPTHDGDDTTIRIDPSTIAARAYCEEALG
jgi:hypothetical protein